MNNRPDPIKITTTPITSPATPNGLLERAVDIKPKMAPAMARGSVVIQFSHPRNGIKAISIKNPDAILKPRLMNPIRPSSY
jgi:hypothetical protein